MGSIAVTESLPIIWRNKVDDATYEEARVGRVFNHRRPNRYPRAVVKATCEEHIAEAVRLASEQGCRVSVRSGGHSWAAWSVRDDAILIDLGNYNFIEFNEQERIVTCSPSTTGRMLNKILLEKGYLFPGGHCPDVGLGGFLLQGGMGWNCKNWGWACENLVAIDVVTADGRQLHCTEDENSEVFWMARGAGPGFPAIVTKYHLRVRESYSAMQQSFWAWPMSKYREVMNWVVKISEGYDEGTEIVALSQVLEGDDKHSICCLFVTFQNDPEAARLALKQANDTRPDGCFVEAINQPTSLPGQYVQQAGANPEGHRYCSENAYIPNDADVASVLEDSFTTMPSKKAFALYYAMHPCSRRQLPDMALSMQTDHYFALYTVWEDATDDGVCQSWVKERMQEVAKIGEGAYLGDSDLQVRVAKYWLDENEDRLMELRKKWDPKGRVCGYLTADDAPWTERSSR